MSEGDRHGVLGTAHVYSPSQIVVHSGNSKATYLTGKYSAIPPNCDGTGVDARHEGVERSFCL